MVNYIKKSGNFLWPQFFFIPNAKCFEYRQTFCMMINRQFLTIVIGFFDNSSLMPRPFSCGLIFATFLLHSCCILVNFQLKSCFLFLFQRDILPSENLVCLVLTHKSFSTKSWRSVMCFSVFLPMKNSSLPYHLPRKYMYNI